MKKIKNKLLLIILSCLCMHQPVRAMTPTEAVATVGIYGSWAFIAGCIVAVSCYHLQKCCKQLFCGPAGTNAQNGQQPTDGFDAV